MRGGAVDIQFQGDANFAYGNFRRNFAQYGGQSLRNSSSSPLPVVRASTACVPAGAIAWEQSTTGEVLQVRFEDNGALIQGGAIEAIRSGRVRSIHRLLIFIPLMCAVCCWAAAQLYLDSCYFVGNSAGPRDDKAGYVWTFNTTRDIQFPVGM